MECSTTTVTNDSENPQDNYITEGVFSSVLGAAAIVLNGICVLAISKQKLYREENKFVFMTSLAVADIIFGLALISRGVYHLLCHFYQTCDILCISSGSFIEVSAGFTILNILLLTVDQFMRIELHMKYPLYATTRHAFVGLIGIILISAAHISMIAALWTRGQITCHLTDRTLAVWYLICGLVFYFLIPLTLICAMHFRIFHIARRHIKRFALRTPVQDTTSAQSRDTHGGHKQDTLCKHSITDSCEGCCEQIQPREIPGPAGCSHFEGKNIRADALSECHQMHVTLHQSSHPHDVNSGDEKVGVHSGSSYADPKKCCSKNCTCGAISRVNPHTEVTHDEDGKGAKGQVCPCGHNNASQAIRQWKAAVTLGIILGILICTWVPVYTFLALMALAPGYMTSLDLDGYLNYVITVGEYLYYTNCVINPMIYIARVPEVKKEIRRMLKGKRSPH